MLPKPEKMKILKKSIGDGRILIQTTKSVGEVGRELGGARRQQFLAQPKIFCAATASNRHIPT